VLTPKVEDTNAEGGMDWVVLTHREGGRQCWGGDMSTQRKGRRPHGVGTEEGGDTVGQVVLAQGSRGLGMCQHRVGSVRGLGSVGT
jgi:hypothetical protein